MHVLVVNIGSTSLKFRLLDMRTERECARGGAEGVGGAVARVFTQLDGGPVAESRRHLENQDEAVRVCRQVLNERCTAPIDAVGFKAVHGGPIAAAVRVDEDVLRTMQLYADACPAHNPAYIAAMRAFAREWPQVPLVAAFETGFHQTIPLSRQAYALPYAWIAELGVRRYGFHGASHAFVAERVAELAGRRDLRIISCHLGGSSSVCAIANGRSQANSFGMAAQSGLPHNNRVGDLDPYALPLLARRTGRSIEELLATLACEGGLLGVSGVSNDMREVLQAARQGHARAALARDMFVESVRHYLGAYAVALGGVDVLVFTGGIGERAPAIRSAVCAGLDFLGITVDEERNAACGCDGEISADASGVRVRVIAANEELIVARQTVAALSRQAAGALSGSD